MEINLGNIMEKLNRKNYPSGHLLIQENQISRKLYILRKGKVRVFKEYLNKKIVLAILKPGEIFGELSFFDAKPRSASVEAIDDITVDCIDGENLHSEIEQLPPWTRLIFLSVAKRFRELDQKIVAYESLSGFKKKSMATNEVGSIIYQNLTSLSRLAQVVIKEESNYQSKAGFIKRLEELAGETYVTATAFADILADYDFLKESGFRDDSIFTLKEEKIKDLEEFCAKEVEDRTYRLPSVKALGVLRKIVSYISLTLGKKDGLTWVDASKVKIKQSDEESQDALKELSKLKILEWKSGELGFNPIELAKKYEFLSVVKSFHSE